MQKPIPAYKRPLPETNVSTKVPPAVSPTLARKREIPISRTARLAAFVVYVAK